MPAPTVPIFPPSALKSRVPAQSYEATLRVVASSLGSLDAASGWSFVRTYLRDQPSIPRTSTTGLSNPEKELRKRVFELAQRVSAGSYNWHTYNAGLAFALFVYLASRNVFYAG